MSTELAHRLRPMRITISRERCGSNLVIRIYQPSSVVSVPVPCGSPVAVWSRTFGGAGIGTTDSIGTNGNSDDGRGGGSGEVTVSGANSRWSIRNEDGRVSLSNDVALSIGQTEGRSFLTRADLGRGRLTIQDGGVVEVLPSLFADSSELRDSIDVRIGAQGILSFVDGGTLRLWDGTRELGDGTSEPGNVVNRGTISVTGQGNFLDGSIVNSTRESLTDFVDGASLTVTGSVVNRGQINLRSGGLRTGSLGLQNESTGTISGSGDLGGPIVNLEGGTIQVGTGDFLRFSGFVDDGPLGTTASFTKPGID